jgi:arginine/lysine/ornithine decarboxylase
MDAGADLCVVSIHKMGAGLEQGSVFHQQGELIDPTFLAACADMLSTTSPNVLLWAGMDGWRRQMVEHGHELLGRALDLADDVREQVAALPGLTPLRDQLIGKEASHELDELKVLVDLHELGISGYQAADWLRAHRAVDVGLSDHRRIEAQLSLADDAETAGVLLEALSALARAAEGLPTPAPVDLPSPEALETEAVMLPRDAFFARLEDVPLREAEGRICAEQVTPYPPGIPLLIAGERVTAPIVRYGQAVARLGGVIADAADSKLETIRVVTGA